MHRAGKANNLRLKIRNVSAVGLDCSLSSRESCSESSDGIGICLFGFACSVGFGRHLGFDAVNDSLRSIVVIVVGEDFVSVFLNISRKIDVDLLIGNPKVDSVNLNAFDNVDLSSFRDPFKFREITFRHETVMGFISEDQLAVDCRDAVLERGDPLSEFVGGSRLSEFRECRVANNTSNLIKSDALVGRVGLVVYDDKLTEVVGAVRAADFSCSSNCR